MFITELDVVNDCLATLGEAPLNAIEEDHPLVAAALRDLKTVNMREQAKGWWFNKELVRLPHDPVTGYVNIPADTINVDPANPWTHLVQRGRRLYDPQRDEGYRIGRPVVCTLIRKLAFDELPSLMQTYVSYRTQQEFQKNYDADRVKADQITKSAQEAYLVLRAEHIRNQGANLLYRPGVAGRMNALGLYEVQPIRDFASGTGAQPTPEPSVVDGIPEDTVIPDWAGLFNSLVED